MVPQDVRPDWTKPQLDACVGADRGTGQIERAPRHRRGMAGIDGKVWALRELDLSQIALTLVLGRDQGETDLVKICDVHFVSYLGRPHTAASHNLVQPLRI